MLSSGMLRSVTLVRTEVSEERRTSIIRIITNFVRNSPIHVTLTMEALHSSETSVLARAKQRNIPEDGIYRSHRRENLKP
jgi:hypothetical protein